MIKAIGYIRVSTDEQAKEGMSLENQEQKIRDYCKLKDFEIVEIIQDAGISAKNLRRPGAQKVLEMAQNKMVDACKGRSENVLFLACIFFPKI